MSFEISHLEKGSGAPLVFLHGLGGDAAGWEFQLDHFSDRYRAIAWNMPGYGASAPIVPMTFPAIAEALIRLFDNLGIDRAHVVGHSVGGMVAQETIALYPDRFQSLVLSATSPAFGKPDGDFQKSYIADRMRPLEEGKTMAEVAAAAIPTMISGDGDPHGLELAITGMAALDPDVYRATVNCLVTFERRKSLGDIAVPTLVLAAEKDANAPAPMMEKMSGYIPGAEFFCLEGCGHLAYQEFPAQFNAPIRDFLTKL